MNAARFSEVRGEFVVLKLELDRYLGSARELPAGCRLAPAELSPRQKRQEQSLLKSNFPFSWQPVFERRTAGWRPDTPVYVLKGADLVGGLYVCADHEFEEGAKWGQLHYFFVAEEEKGKGLHSILVAEAVRRAREWGLAGLYVNTDRHGLPEVYRRWGAIPWKTIPKANRLHRQTRRVGRNWLVHAIHDESLWRAIHRYARGELADIGCGDKPYAELTSGIVTRHIGIDHADTTHSHDAVDVMANAYESTLPDSSIDTVLCTCVLEHLERPGDALGEIRRILRPGGFAIISAPLFWHLHEEPRDFFRFTEHGLRYLLGATGLEVRSIEPLSGFVVTFAQELCYYVDEFGHRLPGWAVSGFQRVVQELAYRAHSRGWDRSKRFTWCYLAVARKPR
jgi:SAM-dependent methyltransferase